MGDRAVLSIDACCEFEANNCIPITWLALFGPDDFFVEKRREGSEEYAVTIYRTLRPAALQRVKLAINRLQGRTPAWAYLRPLEILRDELGRCPLDAFVELDATQFWAKGDTFKQRVIQGSNAFANMLDAMTGDKQQDLGILNSLVNDFSSARVSLVEALRPEDRVFVLIGTYYGEREDLYSMDYFDEAFWTSPS